MVETAVDVVLALTVTVVSVVTMVTEVRHSAREHGICYSYKFEKLIIRRIINIENEVKFCILKKIRLIRNNKRSV